MAQDLDTLYKTLTVGGNVEGYVQQVSRNNTGGGFRLFAAFLDVGTGADKLTADRHYSQIGLFLQAGTGAVSIALDIIKRSLSSPNLNVSPGAADDVFLQQATYPLASIGLTAGDALSRTVLFPVDFVAEAGFTYGWQVRALDASGNRVAVGIGRDAAYSSAIPVRQTGYATMSATAAGNALGATAALSSTWYADELFNAAANAADLARVQIVAVRGIETVAYERVVRVRPSGGDYSHPKLALDAITDASARKRYKIEVYPGSYTGFAEWHTKDFVDIIGCGRREDIVISYTNPLNASAATIQNTSTLWLDSFTTLANLTIRLAGGRYAIHRETNGLKPFIKSRIINCFVEHLGNSGYENGSAWVNSCYGVGAGISGGEIYEDRGSVFRGPDGGFSYHTPNLAPYTDPSHVDVEGCVFTATRTDIARPDFWIKPIRVGAGDTCRLVANTVRYLRYTANEWIDSSDTTSNRAQVAIYGHGNTPLTTFENQLPVGRGADYVPLLTGG